MKKQVYVNRNPKPTNMPWGGGIHFINAIYDSLEDEKSEYVLCDPRNPMMKPDVMLLLGLSSEDNLYAADAACMYKVLYDNSVKLILRVNECDARKNTSIIDNNLLLLSEHLDGTIFVSNWLRDYFLDRGWKCKNNTVIYNGVDSTKFKAQEKLNNGKTNIVTAHWSDNYMKGQDVSEWLDNFVKRNQDRFSYTFIGRTQANLKSSTIVRPLAGQALGNELGKYDVCINATRFDPGPNSVIEPISCCLPTFVHKDGGGAVEFAGLDHVFSDLEQLESILTTGRFEQNNTRDKFLPWEEVTKKVFNFINDVF